MMAKKKNLLNLRKIRGDSMKFDHYSIGIHERYKIIEMIESNDSNNAWKYIQDHANGDEQKALSELFDDVDIYRWEKRIPAEIRYQLAIKILEFIKKYNEFEDNTFGIHIKTFLTMTEWGAALRTLGEERDSIELLEKSMEVLDRALEMEKHDSIIDDNWMASHDALSSMKWKLRRKEST